MKLVEPTLAASMLALLTSCATYAKMQPATRMASHQLACPVEKLQVVQRAGGLYDAQGCNQQIVIRCTSGLCVNLNGAAGERFAKEFGCARRDSKVVEISNLIFKVEGCDKRAVYACDVHHSLSRCTTERDASP